MRLELEIKQSQTLSPQMIQAVEILQMGSLELTQYIQQQLLENPVLELDEPLIPPARQVDPLLQKLEWLRSQDYQNIWYHRSDLQDLEEGAQEIPARQTETLAEHLRTQIPFRRLSEPVSRAVLAVLESLSPNGYFEEHLLDFSRRQGIRPEQAQQALVLVQSLEPAGVGARNLSECICLQLRRRGETGLPLRIAQDFLTPLGEGRLARIARETGASREQVQAAAQLIRTLNPKPGAAFGGSSFTEYIRPDLLVVEDGTDFRLLWGEEEPPPLTISGYYSRLSQPGGDQALRDYLEEKLRQARWVIQSVRQRQNTLFSCAQCVVARQKPFFTLGPGNLLPLTLRDVAAQVSLHESTVCRAIRGKYLQCKYGVFPLSGFFTRGLGGEGEGASADRAHAALARLIGGENKQKPLSDQQLSELLLAEGIPISRRTVAKYRDELGLAAASGRRIF